MLQNIGHSVRCLQVCVQCKAAWEAFVFFQPQEQQHKNPKHNNYACRYDKWRYLHASFHARVMKRNFASVVSCFPS